MAVFVITNCGENHYVNARNQERALWLIKKRLLEKYGKYNITDIKRCKDKPVNKNQSEPTRINND